MPKASGDLGFLLGGRSDARHSAGQTTIQNGSQTPNSLTKADDNVLTLRAVEWGAYGLLP